MGICSDEGLRSQLGLIELNVIGVDGPLMAAASAAVSGEVVDYKFLHISLGYRVYEAAA